MERTQVILRLAFVHACTKTCSSPAEETEAMNSNVAPERGLSLIIDVYSRRGEGRGRAEKAESEKITSQYYCSLFVLSYSLEDAFAQVRRLPWHSGDARTTLEGGGG